MSKITFQLETATPSAPPAGYVRFYPQGGDLKYINSSGQVFTLATGVTPEDVQDIVGSFVSAGSTKASVVYNDSTNSLVIDVVEANITHQNLSGAGTNTHAQLDSHVASTSNPHSVTKSQVGLGNVDNTSDIDKPVSTAQASADSTVQAYSIQRANHSGTQNADTISDFSSAVFNEMNNNLFSFVKEPTGFVTRDTSAISFNNINRSFSITPVGPQFVYYIHGIKYTIATTKSIVIPNIPQIHYIVLNTNNELQSFDTFSVALLRDYALVAVFYWSSTLGEIIGLADERHGLVMDHITHEYLHSNIGARIHPNSFTIGNFTISGDGSQDSHVQASFENGQLVDEDLTHEIRHSSTPSLPYQQKLTPQAYLPLLYLNSLGEWVDYNTNSYLVATGTQRIRYNLNNGGSWSLVDADEGSYVAMWVFATNFQDEPIRAIVGQRQDNNLDSALINNSYENLSFGALPTPEYKVLYRLIFQTSSSYTNTAKARLVHVLDQRKTLDQGTVVTQPTDHGNLSGLAEDDHIQYLLADGSRVLSGDLNLGNNSLINVNLINNIDIGGHGNRHELGGDDEINLVASQISDFNEAVDDRVSNLIIAGSGITKTYDDNSNTLTISTSFQQYTNEQAQDAIGGILVDSSNIDLTYDDVANTISADLINTTVSPSSYGSTTQVGSFTVDAKGRLTSASNTSIQIAESQVTGLTTDLGTKADKTTTISAGTGLSGGGDLTTNRTLNIANTGVTAGSYGGGAGVPSLTVNAQGQLTAISNGPALVLGDNFEYFEDLTAATTTSNVYNTAATFTTTTKDAGQYRVASQIVFNPHATNNDVLFRVLVDGAQVGPEFRKEYSETATQQVVIQLWGYTTFAVATTHTITIQFRTETNASGTLTCSSVNTEMWRRG